MCVHRSVDECHVYSMHAAHRISGTVGVSLRQKFKEIETFQPKNQSNPALSIPVVITFSWLPVLCKQVCCLSKTNVSLREVEALAGGTRLSIYTYINSPYIYGPYNDVHIYIYSYII